ncbi:16S rRNA (adenine(1518)-N(6)/adenine(1519)-N(6))-dimethyltransferase RsmA [Methanofollis fontis]|uniref:Probable ribosomal RNA small subunit methyltransferase A n=1 Tax=Methanofollis fontis TaxID=2052832 RepID=A0A483CU02_9EURY|nr:16S rRNA (adenine(1518)-N(6)/adenine(1519)-N(6))-dimethyltransferase RsmA [Methanofollis fontis]TAJ44808.1 16S rRNA (adenine(1518)-N(6)/adenine(1519)-N(6))-dimethyltransferase [Methanofollis fontis]
MKARHDQHFLIDRRAVRRIVECAGDIAGRRVLEIGPGEGVLTDALLAAGARVCAIELDPALVDGLYEQFSSQIAAGELEVIHGDAVKILYPPFDIVVANLPYSASSPITFRLLDAGFERAVLMYQREFAERMAAPIGTPACGRLSVMVQTFADVDLCFNLPPRAFSPPPQVSSTVVRLTPHEPPHYIADRQMYAVVVRELFSHRRKTVRNGLRGGRNAIGGENVERAIAGLPDEILSLRPEELSLMVFAMIANLCTPPG